MLPQQQDTCRKCHHVHYTESVEIMLSHAFALATDLDIPSSMP
jgi:hypothetical protein